MIALGVIIGIIVILAMVAIGYKNKFVVLDNRVKNSWSQIDVQMQNRFSLVPNLVETVKGYAKHEKETFEGIANAKTRYMSATTPEEKMEQAKLREEYIEGYRRSVRHHIEGIKIVDEEGNDVTPEKLRQVQREKGLHGRSLDDPNS